MHKCVLLGAVFLTGSSPLAAPQTDASWDCKFTQRTQCSASSCSTISGKTWIYLTPSHKAYWRCEGEGFDDCDHYEANVFDSGIYKVFELTGHAGFAKVGPTLDVTEVVTLMDGVWINRGKCMAGPPPLIRVR